MKKMVKVMAVAAAMVAGLAFVACDNGSKGPDKPVVDGPDKPVVDGPDPTPVTCADTEDFWNPACFEGCGIQIWPAGDSFTVGSPDSILICGSVWGGKIGGSYGGWDPSGAKLVSSFSMSHVTGLEMMVSGPSGKLTITPEGEGYAKDAVTVNLTPAEQKVVISHQYSLMDDTGVILTVGSEDTPVDAQIRIRDVRFTNKDGKYVNVQYN